MGKLLSQNIRIFAGVVALALLVTSFQNCGVNPGLGGTKLKANNQSKGNGEGYGGKTTRYANKSTKCSLSSAVATDEAAVLEQRDTDFYLVRDNCTDIEPVKLAAGEVDHLIHREDLALYDGRVFKEVNSAEVRLPVSDPARVIIDRKYCRGSSSAGYPRQVIDLQMDLDSRMRSVTQLTAVNYAAADQVVGPKTVRNLNATVSTIESGGADIETYSGTGLATGESYNLSTDGADNATTSYSLNLSGAMSANTNLALKCYEF